MVTQPSPQKVVGPAASLPHISLVLLHLLLTADERPPALHPRRMSTIRLLPDMEDHGRTGGSSSYAD